ncbi:hypothetical protein [Pseudonocardia sp. HH130630-07]|uniref:hypothetical protein n=1 Tax=Pseudonocardia sp. HH130630-07 TaxID=1690815 RepID=UPI0008153AAE|nr:hypothetical protein [Pseudonocardia sp. HH130630-07]ANY05821.1 hypothetical protein AFB00_05370 [Pseudonocardia sp. HH130630-07]
MSRRRRGPARPAKRGAAPRTRPGRGTGGGARTARRGILMTLLVVVVLALIASVLTTTPEMDPLPGVGIEQVPPPSS